MVKSESAQFMKIYIIIFMLIFFCRFSHPYEFELERFNPLPEQLREIVPIKPKPIEDTPLIEVVTEEQLESLLNDLQNYTEFAVDLEHHSYRSFMGITCLMQVSTKDTDYLIDTLALRDKLFILNEVFTKPSIVKVSTNGSCCKNNNYKQNIDNCIEVFYNTFVCTMLVILCMYIIVLH